MKIYTKTGDSGITSLFGGEKISKNSERINAIGAVDEANSTIGLIETSNKEFLYMMSEKSLITEIQNYLFTVGADLSAPHEDQDYVKRITFEDVEKLEGYIDFLDEKLPELKSFILPRGHFHHARVVVRRAERSVSELDHVNPYVLKFLNRLSDLLFVMARYEDFVNEVQEMEWHQE